VESRKKNEKEGKKKPSRRGKILNKSRERMKKREEGNFCGGLGGTRSRRRTVENKKDRGEILRP